MYITIFGGINIDTFFAQFARFRLTVFDSLVSARLVAVCCLKGTKPCTTLDNICITIEKTKREYKGAATKKTVCKHRDGKK